MTIRCLRSATVLGMLTLLFAACSTDPDYAKQEYVRSGDRFVAEKKYAEAVVQYRNALQQDPRYGKARMKLAQAYERLGDLENTIREYIRAADALPASIEAQLKAGSYLLLARQFEEARTRAENALKLDPKNYRAQLVLGNALAGLSDFEGAIKELEQAVRLDPGAATARTLLGMVQLAHGGREDAEAAFRKAIELSPKQPAVHLTLANYLWSTGRLAEAEQSVKRALSLDVNNPFAHRALASLYMGTRRAAEAEPHLRALADQDQSPGRSLKLSLADYYLSTNRPEDAMKVLEGLSEVKEAALGAQTRVAVIRYVRDGKDDGNRVIDETLARDAKNVPALLVKARFEMAERKLDDALRHAQSAAAADPQSVQAPYLVGIIQRARQRPQDAMAAFQEVLKINPRAVAAQVQLAQLNLIRGENRAALQMASDAARQMPNNARVQLTLVHTLIAGGQLEQAQRRTAMLLKALPNAAPVQVAAGAVAHARKDFPGARRAYTRALELDPTNLDALTGLVGLDFATTGPETAKARLEPLLAKTPDDPNLLILAARTYGSAGDLERAEILLRKVIEVDPTSLQAYGMLGRLYQTQRRRAEAIATYETVLKDHPASVPVNTVVAILYEMEGNHPEARKRYERVLQIDPRAAVAANNLAYIYAERGGNLDIALQLAQTAKQRLPDSPEVADTLGWIYVKKKMTSQAIPQLEQAVQSLPNSSATFYHLGVALTNAGEPEKGRRALERALSLNLEPSAAAEARKLVAKLQS